MMEVYLDHNATTPVRKEVYNAMVPFLKEKFGNPSSLHFAGKIVRKEIERARESIASSLSVTDDEIFFTSGGTEADNLALCGVAFSKYGEKRKKIVISAIEHHAVLETAEMLEKAGFIVEKIPVNSKGIIDLEEFEKIIDDKTLLVSVMLANNELGTVQPVKEIAEISKRYGAIVHTDIVQAFGKIPVNLKTLGVDMASVSAHKIYGPKGTGAIFIKKGLKIKSLFHGGNQEKKIRPGTENPAGIVGFGVAAEIAVKELDSDVLLRIEYLRERLKKSITEKIPYIIINGGEPVVPNTLNVSFAFIEGETLITMLDKKGIAVSTGSACSSQNLEPSHVLLATGLSHELAHGSIRFSLGKDNTEEEIDYTVESLVNCVELVRQMSPLYEDFLKSGKSFEEYLREVNNGRV